jgi:DNA-binding GntR family transcriptional regulator
MNYIPKSVHRQLSQSVYESVRQDIIDLVLRPGTHLRETYLAQRYSVSKTPVREALLQLKKDGLVEILSYRGAIVTQYTHTDLVEIYQLRELIEGSCAREAAQSMPVNDVVELGRIVRVSQESLADGRIDLLPALFNDFDEIIYRQTRNGRIVELLTYLDGHLRRIGNLTVGIPGRLDKSVEQHTEIYDAIAMRDPDEAERIMRHHVRSVLADQVALFQVDVSS